MASNVESRTNLEWFDETLKTKISYTNCKTIVVGGSHDCNKNIINSINNIYQNKKTIFINFDKYIGVWKDITHHDPYDNIF